MQINSARTGCSRHSADNTYLHVQLKWRWAGVTAHLDGTLPGAGHAVGVVGGAGEFGVQPTPPKPLKHVTSSRYAGTEPGYTKPPAPPLLERVAYAS